MLPKPTTLVSLVCVTCSQPFERCPSRVGPFCSRACYFNRILGSPIVRFWEKVERSEHGCWEWKAATRNGYGCMRVDGRAVYAHRFIYTHTYGPIPKGLYVCHRCDNRLCCRPDHLFLGTAKENSRDMAAKGRNATSAHPENTARGSRSGAALLTEADVREIRRAYKEDGVLYRQLAADYGVHRTTIGYIVRRENWRHVE